jgi:hypothetical protein
MAFLVKYFMEIVIRGISTPGMDFPNLEYTDGSELGDEICTVGLR